MRNPIHKEDQNKKLMPAPTIGIGKMFPRFLFQKRLSKSFKKASKYCFIAFVQTCNSVF